MAVQKRRTQIQIEMHEVTIVRFAKQGSFHPEDMSGDVIEVITQAEADPQSTDKEEIEKENEV